MRIFIFLLYIYVMIEGTIKYLFNPSTWKRDKQKEPISDDENFCSPPLTWEKMCGRKGVIIICPKCLRAIDWRLTGHLHHLMILSEYSARMARGDTTLLTQVRLWFQHSIIGPGSSLRVLQLFRKTEWLGGTGKDEGGSMICKASRFEDAVPYHSR